MTSLTIVASDLQAKYGDIKNESNESKFFIKIANYGKCIHDNTQLKPISRQLRKEFKADLKPFVDSWEKFIKEWEPLAIDLISTAKKAGIKDVGPLQNELAELKQKIKKPSFSYELDEIYGYIRPYNEVILKFKNAGKIALISKKHLVKDNNQLTKLDLLYRNASAEWDRFKTLREVSDWRSLDQIMRLYYGMYGGKGKEHYFNSNDAIDSIYEYYMSQISRGERPVDSFLKRHVYEEYLDKLHKYLLPRIEELAQNSTNNKITIDRKKSSTEFHLSINDREIRVNDYLIAKPHAVVSNHDFLEEITKRTPGSQIKRDNLPPDLQKEIGTKSFIKILNALGFTGEITKAFFYKVDANSLYFSGNTVKREQLIKSGINVRLFIKQLEAADAKYHPD